MNGVVDICKKMRFIRNKKMKTNELFEIKGHGRTYFVDEYGILWEKVKDITIEVGFLSVENELLAEFDITYFGETFTKLIDKCDISYFSDKIKDCNQKNITQRQVTEIKKLREKGYTYRYIAEKTGASQTTVMNYVNEIHKKW